MDRINGLQVGSSLDLRPSQGDKQRKIKSRREEDIVHHGHRNNPSCIDPPRMCIAVVYQVRYSLTGGTQPDHMDTAS